MFELSTDIRYFDVRDFVTRVSVNSGIFYSGLCRIIAKGLSWWNMGKLVFPGESRLYVKFLQLYISIVIWSSFKVTCLGYPNHSNSKKLQWRETKIDMCIFTHNVHYIISIFSYISHTFWHFHQQIWFLSELFGQYGKRDGILNEYFQQ